MTVSKGDLTRRFRKSVHSWPCFLFTTAPCPSLHPHLKPGAAPFPLYLLGFPLMLPPFGGHDSTYARCLDLGLCTRIRKSIELAWVSESRGLRSFEDRFATMGRWYGGFI